MLSGPKLLIISSAILLTLPAICSAAPHAGPYVSGFIGVSIPSDSNMTTDDFINSTNYNDKIEFDPGINVGASGGYDFGYLRLEGEISYKHSEIKNVTDRSDSYNFRNSDGSIGTTAFMANAFLDLHNESKITPYFGGGIGFAALHQSDTHATDTRGGTFSRARLYDDGDDTVFAYQVGAGVEIALNRRYSLDIGYRYFATDTATFNGNSSWSNSLKLESHNTSVGFRVTF